MIRVPFLQQRRGFSLAELIIYLGILGISAGIFGGMLNTISTTQIAEFNQNEVSGQLNFAIQTIQRYVRAASIIEGESGIPSSTLVLQMPVAAQNPTSISLQNNRIYITQGATGTPLAITNDKVSIDNLEFRRFAQPASKDVVQIDIAISQESAGGKRIARSLRSAITRVNAAAFDSDLIPNSDGSYNVGTYPSARWRDGSFSGQVSAGSFCFASDCRTSWANIAGVSGSGSANYIAKWNTASTINASTLIYDNGTNVGIGAINPGYKLDVQGGQINTSGGLCINGDCKTAWSQIAGTQAWTATGTSIYYNTGNVGIGMVNPGSKLDVLGDIRSGTSYRTSIQGDGSGARVLFGSEGDPDYLGIIGAFASMMQIDSYNGPLVFKEAGSEKVRITSGNVGIGTTAPGAKLHVSGGSILMDNNLAFKFKDSTGTAQNVFFAGTDNVLYIQPLNVTKGTSIQYGNLGVGTNVPTAKLQVNPGTAVEGIRIISSDYSPFIIRNSADTADLFRVDQNGNITGGTGNASAWTRNSTSGYLYTSTLTDKVGIGTATPGTYNGVVSGLEVKGSSHTGIAINSPTDYAASLTLAENNNPMWHLLSRGDSANRFELYAADGTSNGAKITVLQGGNVGIGTIAPTSRLVVSSSGISAGTPEFVVGDYGTIKLKTYQTGSTYAAIYTGANEDLRITAGTDSSQLVLKANNGNVGIGTASPAQKLSVAGTIESTSGGVKFPDGTTQTTAYAGGTQTIVSGNVSSGAFGSNTGGGNYSFPGNVGIGTTSPGKTLHVVGDVRGGAYYNTNSGDGWLINQDSGTNRGLYYYNTAGTWDFFDGGTSKVSINTSGNIQMDGVLTISGTGNTTIAGNVGIGTTAPQSTVKLDVRQSLTNGTAIAGYVYDATQEITALYGVAYPTTGSAAAYGMRGEAGGTRTTGTNIGGYFSASGATNNYALITGGGNVGIGTASPAQKLSVAGTIESTSGGVKFPDGTTQTTAYAGGTQTVVAGNVSSGAFGANTGGGNYSFPGNMGIGVASPSYKLEIGALSGSVEPTSLKINGGATNVTQIRIGDNYTAAVGTRYSGAEAYLSSNSYQNTLGADSWAKTATTYGSTMLSLGISSTLTSPALQVKFSPASTANGAIASFFPNDLFTILGNGSVGIGTVSPGGKLTVDGSGETLIKLQSGGTEFGEIGTYSSGLIIGTNTAVPLTLETSNTARVTVLGGGNVGIGTTSPGAKLHIQTDTSGTQIPFDIYGYRTAAPASATHLAQISQIGTYGQGVLDLYNSAQVSAIHLATDGNSYIVPQNSGNFGIGTTTPATALHVVGTVTASAFSGALSGTVTAPNVSSGAFGANTGGGNYSFPANVGIGIASPGSQLHVYSATTGIFTLEGATTGAYTAADMLLKSSGSSGMRGTGVFMYDSLAQKEWYAGTPYSATDSYMIGRKSSVASHDSSIAQTSNALLVINNTGNVGIGIANPVKKLQVHGDIALSNGGRIGQGNGWGTDGNSYNATLELYNGATGYTTLQSATAYGILLNPSGGNVGIGTTAPNYKLHTYVASGNTENRFQTAGTGYAALSLINNTNNLYVGVNDSIGTGMFSSGGIANAGALYTLGSYPLQLGTSNLPRVTIDSAGNVGIGTTGPTHKLDVSGSFYSRLITKGNCTGAVTIDWNAGNTQHCVLTGNVTFTFSNGQSGGNYKLVLKQGGTGSYTITWPGTVRWGGAVSPTLTTTVGKSDYVGFFYNGVDSTYDGNAFNANF
ncbi:MAG: hypothetical protein WC099_01060 [Candidatus Paceibacterota bacterium]